MATHIRLRAKDYIPGNEEHEKLLNRMGIHVEMTHTGQTQLIHKAELAVSTAAANEGLVFMSEMIELNKEAEKNSSLDTMRFFGVLIDGKEGFTSLAGPAQFGDDFYESPLIGEVAYGKLLLIRRISKTSSCDFRTTEPWMLQSYESKRYARKNCGSLSW